MTDLDIPDRDDPAAVGRRIARLRQARGLSQTQLAAAVGKSIDSIKSVESGRRQLTLATAQAVAQALGVTNLREIYGDQLSLDLEPVPIEPHLPAVMAALTAYQIQPTGTPSSIDYLRGALDNAWATWHGGGRRSEAGATLPVLLSQAQLAAAVLTGDEQRQAHAITAETYHLAQAYLAHHAPREALYLAVDRGMHHALASGEPGTIGWALWYAAHLWRSIGRSDYALEQLATARDVVNAAPVQDARLQACLVDIWLGAALTRARAHDQSAWADWERARQQAALLPDGYSYPYTRAGVARVSEYAVYVATDLGDTDEARRRSRRLAPEDIGSVDHRARMLVELARTHTGSPEATVHLLLRAAAESAQTVAHTPASRAMIRQLLADPPATIRAEVLRLAETTGIGIA